MKALTGVARDGSTATWRSGWWCVPLALLVMLPRLASPQFGLLDDGFTLRTGRELMGRWWAAVFLIPETGRFVPAYWLFTSAVFAVAGVRPLAFFAAGVLFLSGLLAILARLVRLGGGSPCQAAVAALLFALGGPSVETFYTLSKPEPAQMTWIGLSLLLTAAAIGTARRTARAGLMTLAGATVVLAHATKETAVVLVPISIGWLVAERLSGFGGSSGARFARSYALLTTLAALTFAALRWYFAPLEISEGWYTRAYSIDARTIGASAARIAAWLLRDFAWLAPIVPSAALVLAAGRQMARRVVLYAGIWMCGWLAVFLPWPATFEYYLLPFAFGAAGLGGVIVGELWTLVRGALPRVRRIGAVCALVSTAALWLVGVANAVADTRVQLAVDRANAALVDFLAGLPREGRVLVNTRWRNEYVAELPLHLAEIKRRPDIAVEHLAGPLSDAASPTALFVATPLMTNRPLPTVRIALDEPSTQELNARLDTLLAGRGELVYRGEQRTPVLELGLHRLLCRVITRSLAEQGYCPPDRRLVERRTFSFGWRVHRLGARATGGRPS